jgi:hypothetical protein
MLTVSHFRMVYCVLARHRHAANPICQMHGVCTALHALQVGNGITTRDKIEPICGFRNVYPFYKYQVTPLKYTLDKYQTKWKYVISRAE